MARKGTEQKKTYRTVSTTEIGLVQKKGYTENSWDAFTEDQVSAV